MWLSNWVWLKGLRRQSRKNVEPDPADMGVEIGLDASLDSMLPPLLDYGAEKGQAKSTSVRPLGTDLRSHP